MNILPITPRYLARRDDIFSKLQRETTKGNNNSLACPTYKQKNSNESGSRLISSSKGCKQQKTDRKKKQMKKSKTESKLANPHLSQSYTPPPPSEHTHKKTNQQV